MTAIEQDIEVEQGATFELAIGCLDTEDGQSFTPADLTGYTGTMQIRASQVATAQLLATATVTVDIVTGVVLATIADTLTAAMTWRSGVYDLKITNGTKTHRLARGKARFTLQVTS